MAAAPPPLLGCFWEDGCMSASPLGRWIAEAPTEPAQVPASFETPFAVTVGGGQFQLLEALRLSEDEAPPEVCCSKDDSQVFRRVLETHKKTIQR